jgi:PAS domain S-box-containing protein
MLDEAGNITFCNDFLLRLTGWKRDDLMGRDWCSLLVPEGQYNRDLFSKQLSEKTIPIHHENEIITKAGERRTISWNNTILFDAAGKPIGVATIGEDITERKRMEDALRKSAQALATLFRSSPNTTRWLFT